MAGIDALGRYVKTLRNTAGWTQEELGRRAGYGAGAAVSISRFETGQVFPQKLGGIAEAFGMTVADLTERASAQSNTEAERPNDRAKRIDQEVADRRARLAEVNRAFQEAQQKAKAGFLTDLADLASRIEGAQAIEVASVPRPRTKAAPDTAVDDGHRAVADGALLGAAIGFLNSVKFLPIGGLAVPVVAAVAQIALSLRRDQVERAHRIERGEAELAETEDNFAALIHVVPYATRLLNYVAVHAGHALGRWEQRLSEAPTAWHDLDETGRAQFRDFVEISAEAFRIYGIDFNDLAELHGYELSARTAEIERTLAAADEMITSRV